ncbi:hypothetical protein L873DRAFT_1361751 [Choiromyces venosus 120613-1]|uniref:Uncharacterized protein n=1 Tax=Choiromyces venosus 120613-1 TaxID=1336337 RepID=A0A3N4K7S9_9PEZI|nr:hypothetical protein L873DRAFT_1361751 [Choiromyces venosus 120613-1]
MNTIIHLSNSLYGSLTNTFPSFDLRNTWIILCNKVHTEYRSQLVRVSWLLPYTGNALIYLLYTFTTFTTLS